MPAGSITLADVAAHILTLAVACDRCDRAGRYNLDTLIASHGADCGIPDLLRALSADCAKRAAASVSAYDLSEFTVPTCRRYSCRSGGLAYSQPVRRHPNRNPEAGAGPHGRGVRCVGVVSRDNYFLLSSFVYLKSTSYRSDEAGAILAGAQIMKILIAETDVAFLQEMKQALEQADHQVIVVRLLGRINLRHGVTVPCSNFGY